MRTIEEKKKIVEQVLSEFKKGKSKRDTLRELKVATGSYYKWEYLFAKKSKPKKPQLIEMPIVSPSNKNQNVALFYGPADRIKLIFDQLSGAL